jgi:hypothetical protein
MVEQGVVNSMRDVTADVVAAIDARLWTPDVPVIQVLETLDPPAGGSLVIRSHGHWYSTPIGVDEKVVPPALVSAVSSGRDLYLTTRVDGEPVMVFGVPLARPDTQYFRVVPLSELDEVLRALSLGLLVGTVWRRERRDILGWAASAQGVTPLNQVRDHGPRR